MAALDAGQQPGELQDGGDRGGGGTPAGNWGGGGAGDALARAPSLAALTEAIEAASERGGLSPREVASALAAAARLSRSGGAGGGEPAQPTAGGAPLDAVCRPLLARFWELGAAAFSPSSLAAVAQSSAKLAGRRAAGDWRSVALAVAAALPPERLGDGNMAELSQWAALRLD